MNRVAQLSFDGLVFFSYTPLKLATNFGFISMITSFIVAVFYIGKKLMFPEMEPEGFPDPDGCHPFFGSTQLLTIIEILG